MRESTPDELGQAPSLTLTPTPINIASETLISIREVPKRLPKKPGGKRVHISAVYRWMNRGVRRVRLESIRIGGTNYTSVEALQRFAERLSAPSEENAPPPTPRRRQAQIDAAAKEASRILDRGSSNL